MVITSDNPRSEDPAAIIAEIVAGISPDAAAETTIEVIEDRGAAIHHAARAARNDDVVVVAGKGHETTQTFADRTVPFDDREVAAAALAVIAGEGSAR